MNKKVRLYQRIYLHAQVKDIHLVSLKFEEERTLCK